MSIEHGSDSYGTELVEVAPGGFDDLVRDGADVRRHLAEVPRQSVVVIPARAVALVAGLDSYGD